MGRWINEHNLPDRVIKVIQGKHKERKPELNRLSITDLIEDPLSRVLYVHHWDDIVRDYSDLLTAVQGIALHSRYEMVASDDDDAEHKFEDVINNIIVVGKADNYFIDCDSPCSENPILLEVKQTGVYGPKYRIDKWTKQMNCYAWQRRKRGQEVNKLLVDVWYRDWKESNIHWKDYPPIAYECIELDLWDFETQDKYIRERVWKHTHYPVYTEPSMYEHPCSDAQRGIRWEAHKGKNKTPTKVGDTYDEVNQWAGQQWVGQQSVGMFKIVQSDPVFCRRYCKSRSICPFAISE